MNDSMLPPALVWPQFDADEMAGIRRLRRRLKRARADSVEAHSLLELTARALGIETPPAAALARLGEGLAADPAWCLAEPVTLVPDRDRLMLRRLGPDALAADEARALVEAVHAHFPADELRLEPVEPGRWYARLGAAEPRAGIAPAAAEGVSLPATPVTFGVGREGLRVLNELQMLWFEHPVNRERKQSGRPQANALWLWGGGALPAPVPPVPARAVATGEVELKGLATWLGLERRDPANPEATPVEPGLVVAIDAGGGPAAPAWLEAFASRRQAFRVFAAGRAWTVPARRFWRRW